MSGTRSSYKPVLLGTQLAASGQSPICTMQAVSVTRSSYKPVFLGTPTPTSGQSPMWPTLCSGYVISFRHGPNKNVKKNSLGCS
jgi:hypothetical protein